MWPHIQCFWEGITRWGLIHYDNRRSPWWASRHGPQHDRSRSDAIAFCINLKKLCQFGYIFQPFLFCSVLFLNKNYTYYTSVNCVWVLLPLFGFSAECSRLACSKISPIIKEKKEERSQSNGRTQYKLADGVTALAQLRVLNSDKTHSFN